MPQPPRDTPQAQPGNRGARPAEAQASEKAPRHRQAKGAEAQASERPRARPGPSKIAFGQTAAAGRGSGAVPPRCAGSHQRSSSFAGFSG
ncbi:hypothetical protein Aoc01nite_57800 [Actinoplanes octamycinicus]|nr:hypothetical protein Aoc01nite_57800 [Actinoplanes octamycinicus]